MSRRETVGAAPPGHPAPGAVKLGARPRIGVQGRRAAEIAALFEGEGYATDRAGDCAVWALDVEGSPLDALGALRELARSAPVIMLTAPCGVEERLAALDHGAAAVLIRPADAAELLARAAALIRRSRPQAPPVLRVAGVEIDPARRVVRHDGRPAPLTANEFLLFSYLARNAGRVVSRAELGLNLLAGDDDMASNVVEVTVSRIRRKLRPDVILTRRGEGYLTPG